MFEQMRGIKFSGAAFNEETTLNLFPDDNSRLALVYGRNGTGKSTVARAFSKIKGETNSDIASALLVNPQNNVIPTSDDISSRVHVFSDEYVQTNVRLKEDGLSTIVMFGSQGNLDDQIAVAQNEYQSKEDERARQEEICSQYANEASTLSPGYFLKKMSSTLTGDSRWSGREREIFDHHRNASVNSETYKKIIEHPPECSEADVLMHYNEKFQLLSQAKTGNAKIEVCVPVDIPEVIDESSIKRLLEAQLERPELSKREEYLLTLVETGQLANIQNVFSATTTHHCPFCLQPVSTEYKSGLIESITKVLSRDVELHKAALSEYIRDAVTVELTPFDKLDRSLLDAVNSSLNTLNAAISRCNSLIQQKISNPFAPVVMETLDIQSKRNALIVLLSQLEQAREHYNEPFDDIKRLQKELQVLNKQRAYFEILPFYQSFMSQDATKRIEDQKLTQLTTDTAEKLGCLNSLRDQQRNITIAVDIINRNLRYVFFAENRLSIRADNGTYSLLSRGHEVKPADISIGERNVIALCYFFASMLTNLTVENGYSEEMCIILDDPISSFDFENKVGIMSFLRFQLEKVITGNQNTKVLILSHDLPAVYDMKCALEEITGVAQQTWNHPCLMASFELKNQGITPLNPNKRNEYSELLKTVFNYAKTRNPEYELSIGNTMRRALETFSTFVYKKGISNISCDATILSQLGTPEFTSYFSSLMYRLVLNGESHMQDRARTLMDPDFTVVVSPEEKQRTAQDIICFMYLLNPLHIKAHLAGVNGFENEITSWCTRIQQFEHTNNT